MMAYSGLRWTDDPPQWRLASLTWAVFDIVAMLEQWELANLMPEYQFVVRQCRIGKGYSVSVLWRGGEVDTIFGFAKEAEALQWIKEKSQGWLIERTK